MKKITNKEVIAFIRANYNMIYESPNYYIYRIAENKCVALEK